MKTQLRKHFFDAANREFLTHESLSVQIHRTDREVEILTITSDRIRLVMLPFQGQQIWNVSIDGIDITMKSEVTEPRATTDYLTNYGAFLVHCGATAMGGPSPEDTHPLHGELPNASYNSAWLETGYDDLARPYIEVHGEYLHQVAMTVNYMAHPVIRITEGDPLIRVSMTIHNQSRAAMDLMYLAHINFAPVSGSVIEATHEWDSESVRVRSSFPAHIHVDETTKQQLKELAVNPKRSANIEENPAYDPEAVMSITYVADANGQAHSLQVHPDGTSDYVMHEPASAPHPIRCIQLTDHHKCVGLVLPSTAGVEGYISEKEQGRVISLASGDSYIIEFAFAALDVQETQYMRRHIRAVMDRTSI